MWRSIVLTFFGARWLGHGRKLEGFLTCIAGSYGITLLVSSSALHSPGLYDLAWSGYVFALGMALLVKTLFSGYGLLANINAWPWSRQSRFLGAMVGSGIWVWFLSKFALAGDPTSFVAIFAGWAFIFSVQIMASALADLPKAGAPGAI